MSESKTSPSLQWPESVALVGPLPPPAGGMANQTLQLAELLRSVGVVVVLVQTNAPYRPALVAKVPFLRSAFRFVPYLWSLSIAIGRCKIVHVMANSGWAWHLFAAPAIWVGWILRVPVIVNYRGGEAERFLERSSALVRSTMCRARHLIVPSTFLQSVFGEFGMPSRIVPNVVDLTRFHPSPVPRAASSVILVARNLEPLYDNSSALRAFKIVLMRWPTAEMTIAGTGPEEAALRHLAAELGIAYAVHFVGRQDRDAMAALYQRADIVLNPSLADNTPNSILEALASGVPVVSTNVGGVPHLVENEVTAMLVPPGDAPSMAAACQRLLEDEDLRAKLIRGGLAEVQRYTWTNVAPLLASCYQNAR